jgi:DNA-binding winged helix-turn-helix (wHTH) protein
MRFGFDDFVVDFPARELRRGGRPVHLEPKTLDFLELLIGSRPRVLAKAEILERLWPSTFVSESSLSRLVAELRAALGDDARSPRLIRTVHRKGYSFVGPVEELGGPARLPAGPPPCRLLFGERVLSLQPGENLVGRGDEAGVRIDSAKVSRVHARIAVAASSATVEDLGSKNGTFVRGRRIAGPVELADGDEICLGSVLLVFRRPSAPRSTETESI